MKATKEQMLMSLALKIIDFEEFTLTEEEGRFKLIDATGTNLGEIEQDRFDTLAEVLDRLDTYHDDYFISDYEERAKDPKKYLSLFERMAYHLLHNTPADWCEILDQIKPEDFKDWSQNDDGTYSQSIFDDFRNDRQNIEFMEQELSQSFLQSVATDLPAYEKEEEGTEGLQEQEEEER